MSPVALHHDSSGPDDAPVLEPAVDRIVKLCPRERQTLFFSATLQVPADGRGQGRAPKRGGQPQTVVFARKGVSCCRQG